MYGFIVLDKESNMTSQQAVNRFKHQFNIDKCGHTGTLDPLATGVLVIAIGDATKAVSFLPEKYKEYEADVILGINTDSYDITGNIIENNDASNISCDLIDQAIEALKQTTTQIPPKYSAIWINGRRAYDMARNNENFEIKERDIIIYDLKRLSNIKIIDGHPTFKLYIRGSKGIYIRSVVYDLGKMLGCGATVKTLRRISSGVFNLNMAKSLKNLENLDNLITIEEAFKDLEYIEVNDYMANLVKNGIPLDERQIKTDKEFLVYHNHKAIALYEVNGVYKYKPAAIFKEAF